MAGTGRCSSNPDRLAPKVVEVHASLAGCCRPVAVSQKKRVWERAPITPHVQGCYVAVRSAGSVLVDLVVQKLRYRFCSSSVRSEREREREGRALA